MANKTQDTGTLVFKENRFPGESLYSLDPDGHKLEVHVGNSEVRITAKKITLAAGKMWRGLYKVTLCNGKE